MPRQDGATDDLFIDDGVEQPPPQQQAVAPTPTPYKVYTPSHKLEALTQKMAHYDAKRLDDGIHDHSD